MNYSTEEMQIMKMAWYQRSAIIGYYRMEAPVHIIALIAGIEQSDVEEIITNYKKSMEQRSNRADNAVKHGRRSYGYILSDNDITYIKANYNRMSITEIASNLQLQWHKVSDYMNENGIRRVLPTKQTRDADVVSDGFFNSHEKDNWLI